MRLIPKWWLKCATQRILSHVPLGRRINNLWSKRARIATLDELALQQGLYHIKLLRENDIDIKGATVLEIGSGWKPVIPYIFRCAGCDHVILCDFNRYMTHTLLCATIQEMRERVPTIADSLGMSAKQIESVLPNLNGQHFEKLLNASGFIYRAPFDARGTDYTDGSIDIVTSRSVLEHIPTYDIVCIMREMKRILRPDGVMVHTIDHSDHWQHFDHSISHINFLKFPEWLWSFINSPIAYQNRLRSCEYLRIIEEAGFEIVHLEAVVNEQALLDLKGLRLARKYGGFTHEQLAVLRTHVVARLSMKKQYRRI